MSRSREELAAIATKMNLVMPEDLLPSEITAIICLMLNVRGIRCAKLVIEKGNGAKILQYHRSQ